MTFDRSESIFNDKEKLRGFAVGGLKEPWAARPCRYCRCCLCDQFHGRIHNKLGYDREFVRGISDREWI
jgi:hypothetical protein